MVRRVQKIAVCSRHQHIAKCGKKNIELIHEIMRLTEGRLSEKQKV